MREFTPDKELNRLLNAAVVAAVEDALLQLPAITAKLLKTSISLDGMTSAFLTNNPGFEQNKDVVQKLVMQAEAENPGKGYDEILNIARPRIVEFLKTVRDAASQPSLNFDSIAGR